MASVCNIFGSKPTQRITMTGFTTLLVCPVFITSKLLEIQKKSIQAERHRHQHERGRMTVRRRNITSTFPPNYRYISGQDGRKHTAD